ncbi:MAG: hypothetical protein AB7N73_06230 [Gemmatimonadales bacterium]
MPPRALITILLLTACGGAAESPAFATRDSAGITIAENRTEAVSATCRLDADPVVRIGGSDAPEDQFLYRVMGASRLSDGRIAVVNQGTQEVRWYDSTGTLVGRAGREGSGPGEFKSAFLMVRLTGDTLWVGDSPPWQWHIFGPEMTFVRTVMLDPPEPNDPRLSAIMDTGEQLYGYSIDRPRGNWTMDSVAIRRHAPDGTLVDTVMTIPNGRWGQTVEDPSAIWLQPWFEPWAHFDGVGSRVAVSTLGASELRIYAVGTRVTPTRVVRWTTGDRQVTDAAVAAARERITARYASRYPGWSPEMKATFLDPQISSKRPVADVYPAVTGLVMGRDGRIWVREYAEEGADTRRWLAFSAEGRALCHAEFPAVEVAEIGSDYLLAKTTDALDAEQVVLYRLRGEGSE